MWWRYLSDTFDGSSGFRAQTLSSSRERTARGWGECRREGAFWHSSKLYVRGVYVRRDQLMALKPTCFVRKKQTNKQADNPRGSQFARERGKFRGITTCAALAPLLQVPTVAIQANRSTFCLLVYNHRGAWMENVKNVIFNTCFSLVILKIVFLLLCDFYTVIAVKKTCSLLKYIVIILPINQYQHYNFNTKSLISFLSSAVFKMRWNVRYYQLRELGLNLHFLQHCCWN